MNTGYWKLINQLSSKNSQRAAQALQHKRETLEKLWAGMGHKPQDILIQGYTPVAESLAQSYNVTMICDDELALPNVRIASFIDRVQERFDTVLALDEYFTYHTNENAQRAALEQLRDRTNGFLFTTLQDYRNLSPQRVGAVVIHDQLNHTLVQKCVVDPTDSQVWKQSLFHISNAGLETYGPTTRRTMYFKQLAKYAQDAGCEDYKVDKNVTWRGFFKNYFEHIIAVKFS